MRKVLWTAAVLALCAAPAAAQQTEKPLVDVAPAREVVAAEAPASRTEPAAAERPSLRVSDRQMDETIRTAQAERGERKQQMGNNFWYTVAAVAIGVIVASLLLR
jgi:hypothetical protein